MTLRPFSARIFFLGGLLFGAFPSTIAAQTRATADLRGVVSDPANAVIQGATISVRDLSTNLSRDTASNQRGEYTILGLPPGSYELTVEAKDFAKYVRADLELRVGQVLTVDVSLVLPGVTQDVLVTTSPAVVETTRTEQSQAITPRLVAALPVNGRNFFDFSLLTPNVSRGRANLNTPLIEAGISFAGLRGQLNNVSVDGLDNNDAYNGASRATISQEAVQEFRVVNNSFGADVGRAMGGLVNVVTKSGGNTSQVSAFEFVRDARFDARSILAPNGLSDHLRQHQFGAVAGGPIKRDALFYFTSYEGQRRRQRPQFSTFVLSNISAINAQLARLGYAAEPIDTVEAANDNDKWLGKIHGQTGRTSVTARYNIADMRNPNAGVGGINLPSNGRQNTLRDQSGVFTAVSMLSMRFVNDFRVQVALRQFHNPPVSRRPNLLVAGLLVAGDQFDQIRERTERRIQVSNSLTWLRNGHTVKVGGEINAVRERMNFFAFGGGRIVFAGLAGFLNTGNDPAGFSATTFQVSTGNPETTVNQPTLEAFAQDEWRATPHLTVNFGARYTLDLLPTDIMDRDYNNVQPRVGAVYSFGEKHTTVVRAGYGVFISTFQILQHINPRLFGGNGYTVSRNQPAGQVPISSISGAAATGAALAYLTSGTIPASAAQFGIPANRHAPNSYSQQASVQVERQLGERLTVRLGYVHTRGSNLNRIQNINLLPPVAVLPSGKPDFQFRAVDPRFSAITEYNSNGRSRYHGASLTVERRFHRRFSLTLNYTASKAMDDTVNFSFQNSAENEYDKGAEWARSVEHVPHRFAAYGVWQGPDHGWLGGFQFAGTAVAESGRFFNVTVGADANHDFNAQTDRPFTFGRNTLQGRGYVNIDARVSKFVNVRAIRLEFLVEAFNILNRVNVQSVSGVWGTGTTPLSSYGTPNAVFNPRQLQLGFRASF